MTSLSISIPSHGREWAPHTLDSLFPEKLIIVVSGALNTNTCAGFQKHVERDFKPEILIFDLEKLYEIDGNGLGVLLTTSQCLMLRGKKVILQNLNGQPKELLTYLGIEKLLG